MKVTSRLLGVLAIFGIAMAAHYATSSTPFSAEKSATVEILTLKMDQIGQIEELSNAGYDIAGVDFGENLVDVVVNPTQKDMLLGLYPTAAVQKSTPINATIAPDEGFTTPDELDSFMRDLADNFPGISRLEVVGTSVEGREILALKITDNPDLRELEEPTILFNAMHHAREVMTTEVAMDTAEYLLNNYGVDSQVTDWVDSTEVWVVPMLNPDGNNKVWTEYSMWRKNTRDGYGVDLNRNYPYNWDTCGGSSGNRYSDTYRGPTAGSEPETQALMDLVARIQPVFNISYHSYSEMVLYPYGCRGQRTATQEVVEGVGQTLAGILPSDDSESTFYEPGTPWEILYSVDGGDIDWMYGEHHVIPYVIELNSRRLGFQPDFRWRQPTVEKLRTGWGYLLDRLAGSGIRGVVRDGSGRVQPDAQVTFNRTFPTSTDAVTFNVKRDGTYHLVLLPGAYSLTFELNGRTITEEINVTEDISTLDIEL